MPRSLPTAPTLESSHPGGQVLSGQFSKASEDTRPRRSLACARRFLVSTGEAESEETKVASWGLNVKDFSPESSLGFKL